MCRHWAFAFVFLMIVVRIATSSLLYFHQRLKFLRRDDIRGHEEPQPVVCFARFLARDLYLRYEVGPALAALSLLDVRADGRTRAKQLIAQRPAHAGPLVQFPT